MVAIQIRRLSKIFQDRASGLPFHAVNNVSFEVAEGSFVTLLGPSGCGKTTILRMIAGFEFPNSGEILAFGNPITRTPPEKRNLPVVFQNYALFPHMDLFENVAYPLRVKKWKTSEIKNRVGETLELMNLRTLAKRRPSEISGGQQQRVALARALVSRPKVVLFDEPLSNLDAKLREQMCIELKKLQRRAELTALYVTHDQEEAMSLSDLVIVMNEGKIQQIDTPENIYFRPCNRFVADFIGKANFVPVSCSKSGSNFNVTAWSKRIENVPGSSEINGFAEMVIRPEGVQVHSNGSGDFEATVSHSSFLGNVTICELETMGQKLLIELPAEKSSDFFQIGQKVTFSLDSKRLYLLPK